MSIEIAAWFVFASFFFVFLTSYYAANSKVSMTVLVPLAIAWLAKTAALIAFGIYFDLWAFFAIACLDIFTIVISAINVKESK